MKHSVILLQKTENIVNGSGDLNHNHEPDLNSVKHAVSSNKVVRVMRYGHNH